jgi:hypothetical protein
MQYLQALAMSSTIAKLCSANGDIFRRVFAHKEYQCRGCLPPKHSLKTLAASCRQSWSVSPGCRVGLYLRCSHTRSPLQDQGNACRGTQSRRNSRPPSANAFTRAESVAEASEEEGEETCGVRQTGVIESGLPGSAACGSITPASRTMFDEVISILLIWCTGIKHIQFPRTQFAFYLQLFGV